MAYPYSYPTQPAAVYQYGPGYGSTSTGHGVRPHQTTANTTYPNVYSAQSAPPYYPRVPAGPLPALPPYTYYPQHVSSGTYGPAAPPYYQQHGGGGVFNRWPGAPEEDEEAGEEDRSRRQSHRGHRSRQERGHHSYHSPSRSVDSNSYYNSRNDGDADEDEDDDVAVCLHDDVFFDDGEEHVDARLRAHSLAVTGREEVAYGRAGGDDEADEAGELVREVVVHPGGSGRVVLHVDSDPPRLTSFRVSARRMRSSARSWTQVCHRGTNACDTTVADETAVAGMYWLLRVLHDEPEVGVQGGSGAHGGYDDHQDHDVYEARLHNLVVQGAVPVPRELPARVLAYVVMFGQQLGALGRPGSMGGGAALSGVAASRSAGRLRAQSEAWLWALMNRRRDRHVLDASAVDDWPFLLYASQSLDSQDLVRRCLQMLSWDR